MAAKQAGELVRRYRHLREKTQEVIARELTNELGREVKQGHVSAHFRGQRWTLDLPGAYIRVLDIPQEEMAAAWGWAGEAADPAPPRAATLADVIKADDTLSPAAKKHLLAQYGLLQLASQRERESNPGPVNSLNTGDRESRRSPAG